MYKKPDDYYCDVLSLLKQEHPEIVSVSRFLLESTWDAGKSVREAADEIARCGAPGVAREEDPPPGGYTIDV